eukprot:scaffold131162_cov23-Prasinocladus_malaysianus.AAC.1
MALARAREGPTSSTIISSSAGNITTSAGGTAITSIVDGNYTIDTDEPSLQLVDHYRHNINPVIGPTVSSIGEDAADEARIKALHGVQSVLERAVRSNGSAKQVGGSPLLPLLPQPIQSLQVNTTLNVMHEI